MVRLVGSFALVLALCAGAGAFLGSLILRAHLAYTHASIGWQRATFDGLRVTLNGPDPFVEAEHAEVSYNLRDLAVGSQRALGLAGIVADRPRITLVHYANGTWNAPIQPRGGNGPSLSLGPFVFDARIHDGSIDLRDQTIPHEAVRELKIGGVQVDAHIDQHSRSTYRAEGALLYKDRSYPIFGRGLLDERAGYEDNHWTSRAIPLVPLAGLMLAMPQASVAGGSLDYVDAHYSGLSGQAGGMARHLTARGYLNGLRIYLSNVKASLRNVHGDVYAYDDGATAPRLDASLSGISIALAGGVYHLQKPELRFGVRARGSLASVARLASALSAKHLTGDLGLTALAEGPIAMPLVLAAVHSNALTYGAFPLAGMSALVAVEGRDADIMGASARYGPFTIGLRGTTLLGSSQANAEGLVRVRGPLQAIPYAAALPGRMDLDATLTASGVADAFTAGGLVTGDGQGEHLDGTVRFAPSGTGTIGPLVLERADGSSLYARVSVDRRNGVDLALVDAERLPLDTRRAAQLPDFAVPRLPPARAVLSARLGAQIERSQVAALGDFRVSDVKAAGFPVDGVTGTIALNGSSGALTARAGIGGGTLIALGSLSNVRSLTQMDARIGVALTGATYRKTAVNATSGLRLSNGRLQIGGASASYGAAVAMLDGSVSGLGGDKAKARYDLRARMIGAPIAFVASMTGHRLPYPAGAIDADVRVRGAGASPQVAGTIAIPEGSINGLAFADAAVELGGTPQALDARNGHVTVGSTTLQFDGRYSGKTASGTIRAARTNLADFNEYFEVADTLAGSGSVATSFSVGPSTLATGGAVDLRGVRVRRFDLGAASARWSTRGRIVAAQASIAGASGRLRFGGDVALPASDPLRDVIRRSGLDVTAAARGIDLRQYLPLLGLDAPVTGLVDADATVRGTYPALRAAVQANVVNGSIGRLPLETATASVTATNGRARLESARIAVRHLTIAASGDAGLRQSDQLNLTARIVSDDVGALYNEALGKKLPLSGTLDSTAHLTGTVRSPTLADTFSLDNARYESFVVPHAAARIAATRTSVTMPSGEVDFERGRLLASGTLPIARTSGPLRIGVTSEAIDLGSFAALLPKGSKVGGSLNGTITVAGSVDDPLMSGGLTLADGSFSAPFFRAAVTRLGMALAFAGRQIAIRDAAASVGGGNIAGAGTVTVANFRTPARDLTFRLEARTRNAGFDVPAYFRGKVNSDVVVSRAANAPITVGGRVAIEHARIPVNALYNPNASKSGAPPPLPVAFNDLAIDVGQDVRVQSSVVDVGARGSMTIAGTLAAPALDGTFEATGGTVDVYHDFRVVRGQIAFHPDQGLMPSINALAVTTIDNPPTDIALHITGTVPNLDLGLSSDPQYSRSQILGLLLGVQALGAVQGLPQTGGATQAFNAASLAENEAEGVLRTQLTRGLFEPLQNSLGNALGFNNLQLYLNDNGGFTARATKGLAKHVNAVFGETFGPVSRQIIGIRATPNNSLALQATYYQQEGAVGFTQYNPSYLQSLNSGTLNQTLIATTPSTGTNGYSFSVQRRYP